MIAAIDETPTINPKAIELDTLISTEQLAQRISTLAAEINDTFKDTEQLVVIGVLKGSFIFLADLVRQINVPTQIEFVRLASYGNQTQSSGEIKPVHLTLPNLEGKDVLIVEDIMDSGLTLNFFMDYLKSLHRTNKLKVSVLLDKPNARASSEKTVKVDFKGFDIGNEFVVGYGLDYQGYFRNLPYIAVVKNPQG